MPRPNIQHGEPVNGDSFLDIVASVVSIMIIMVVMEGMRIKNTPLKPAAAAAAAARAVAIPRALRNELATEQSLRADILKMADETQNVEREAAARGMERDLLATAVAAAQHEIQDRRQKLDGVKRADFDLDRGIAASRLELDEINRQRTRLESSAGQPPVVVESFPTPISRAVDGPEAHLLISHGRVVFIPLQALLELMQAQARREAHEIADQQDLTDTVGPVAGFRLRYTLERHDVSIEKAKDLGRPGSYIRLRSWTLIPPDTDPGEPVRLALQDDSDFRHALRKVVPGQTAVTIWVYPDGFDAFRQVRKGLYQLGYAVAARPLPVGQAVAGSADGSKSAAQ
jgi:hypothetical protein